MICIFCPHLFVSCRVLIRVFSLSSISESGLLILIFLYPLYLVPSLTPLRQESSHTETRVVGSSGMQPPDTGGGWIWATKEVSQRSRRDDRQYAALPVLKTTLWAGQPVCKRGGESRMVEDATDLGLVEDKQMRRRTMRDKRCMR